MASQDWEPAYARRLYRWFAPFYDGFRWIWSRWTRSAENELDGLFGERITASSGILELAPGTGINLERLFRRAPAFRSYLGIDVSEAMLARARPKARGDARVELRIGDATDLSSLEGEYDFLVSTWLLSHLEQPEKTVRSAVGKLAAGGTAAFVFWTAPDQRLLRAVLGFIARSFRARFVDPRAIAALPGLERIRPHAGGMATLAVFRAEAGRS